MIFFLSTTANEFYISFSIKFMKFNGQNHVYVLCRGTMFSVLWNKILSMYKCDRTLCLKFEEGGRDTPLIEDVLGSMIEDVLGSM